MSERHDLGAFTPTERLVLSALAEFERRDRTPVRTPELRQLCRACTTHDESLIVGTVSEADVTRSLYRLESTETVRAIEPESTSPVGKGRPSYALAVDVGNLAEDANAELPAIDVPDEFWEE